MRLFRGSSLVAALSLCAMARDARGQAAAAPASIAQRACEHALNAAQALVLRSAARYRRGRTVPHGNFGIAHCYRAGQGYWLVALERPVFRQASYGGALVDGEISLTFFSQTGAVVRAARDALGEFGRVRDRPSSAVPLIDDLDRDGTAELVWVARPTATTTRLFRPLTVRDNAVRPFAVATTIRVDDLESVDHDADHELLEHTRFQAPTTCDDPSSPVRSVDAISFVATRDGARFRTDSDAARAWARAQCPERPEVIVPHRGITAVNANEVFTAAVQRVACARVWGMTPEAIARTFPARWPAVWSCTSAADLIAFATSVRPPLTLTPMRDVRAPERDAMTNYAVADLDEFIPQSEPLEDAPPAVSRVCVNNNNRVNATLAAVVRQSQQSVTTDELEEFFGQYGTCLVGAPHDAWSNSFVRLRWDAVASDDEPGILGSSRLFHVDASARVVFERPAAVERLYDSSTVRQVIGAFDFDGDGTSEAIARTARSASEAGGESDIELLTVRGGAIRPYAPTGGVPTFQRLVDFDDDGRPDLLDWTLFTMESDSDAGTLYSVRMIAHSRADGTFSSDDATVREFVATQCTAPPDRIVALEEGDANIERSATLGAIVCARFYGESSERIVARLWAESNRLDEDEREWLQSVARAALWRVPFTLGTRPASNARP